MAQKKQAIAGQAEDLQDDPKKVFERLGLNTEEILALRQRGFVSQELRGAGMVMHKLRFRVRGQQRVRYLGTDPVRCAAIATQLKRLQRVRDLDAKLRKVQRAASELLKASKRRLEPGLAEAGWHFHGRAIRRCRRPADNPKQVSLS